MNLTLLFLVVTCFSLQFCIGMDLQFLKKEVYYIQKYLDEDILSIIIIYKSGDFEDEEHLQEFLAMFVQMNVFANEFILSER